jgi:nitroreductase
MDALEAMETCRAMRWLKPDPVPEELIRKVLRAATSASSPGNSQGWDFVVVREPGLRKQIAEVFKNEVKPRILPVPESADSSRKLMSAGAHHLLDNFDRVPVLIFVCGAVIYPRNRWTSCLRLTPAAQNLIVAARRSVSAPSSPRSTALRGRSATARPPDTHRIQVTIPWAGPKEVRPREAAPARRVVHWDRY